MKIAYIAHPISGDIESNLADLRRIVKKVNTEYPEVVPFVPYYVDIVSLDDNIPEERERGIKNDKAILMSGCVDELWVTGTRISTGMNHEIVLAKSLKIPVVDMMFL